MSRWIAAVKRDEGMALATVMAVSAVLFIMATSLVLLATQGQVNASGQMQRTEALQAADAGISAYCYQLMVPGTGGKYAPLSGSTSDATWTVTSVPPVFGSQVTVITALGTVPARNGRSSVTRKVVANVRPGSAADFMFMWNTTPAPIGATSVFHGTVWSNGNLVNNGEITGEAHAVGTITGSGVIDKPPPHPNEPKPHTFATVNFPGLLATATADGTYWGDSGTFTTTGTVGNNLYTHHYCGYKVVLSGTGGTVTKVMGIWPATGTMMVDTSTVQSFTTPDNGVLYFDDPIWLSGSYSSKVTVVDGDDRTDDNLTVGLSGMNPTSTVTIKPNTVNSSVFIWNNLVSSDPTNPYQVCGVVAQGDISLTSDYPTAVTPNDLIVQAACFASQGGIHADLYKNDGVNGNGVVHRSLTLTGSFASFSTGAFALNSGTTAVAGFGPTRNYYYDDNLDITLPPNYPTFLGDGSMQVKSWTEY